MQSNTPGRGFCLTNVLDGFGQRGYSITFLVFLPIRFMLSYLNLEPSVAEQDLHDLGSDLNPQASYLKRKRE